MPASDESARLIPDLPVKSPVQWFHPFGPMLAFRLTKRADHDFNIKGGGGFVSLVEVFEAMKIKRMPGGKDEYYSTVAPVFIAKFQGQTDGDGQEQATNWIKFSHEKSVMAAAGTLNYGPIKVFKEGNQWCALLGDNLQEGKAGFGNTKSLALAELAVGLAEGKATQKIPDEDRQTKTGVNALQFGGDHYKDRAIEPWDYVLANGIGFCEGNAIKYLTRWKDKGGVEDLKKALHYIQKLIEKEEGQ
jgi:hypothetical protein